jgi:AcrR family transcriptional regulator
MSETVRPTGGRRSAKANQTRQLLVDAAVAVFAERGFPDTTISDITGRAGVAHGTFYTHFDSKEEIFRDVVRWIQTRALQATTSPPEPTVRTIGDRIERNNRQFLEVYRVHSRTLASYEELASRDPETALLRAETRHAYIGRTTGAIERWQRDGLVDPALDAAAIAHCLGSMVERVAHMHVLFDDGPDDDRLLAALSHIWAEAIGLPDGERVGGQDATPPPAEPRTRTRSS